jgi:hypothetical protein
MTTGKTQRHPLQVNSTTYESVRALATATGEPMTRIVERAVERLQREMTIRAHNEAWLNLMKNDPEAIEAFRREDALWDQTTGDGIIDKASGA